MCRQFISTEEMESSADCTLPDPLTRSYRRLMKPRLPRKVTSSARINLNKFWNELEEFYQRHEDRRENNNNIIMPEWARNNTDREEEENRLNEKLEMERGQESFFLSPLPRLEPMETAFPFEDTDSLPSSPSSASPPVTPVWNRLTDNTIVPRELLDLAQRVLKKS